MPSPIGHALGGIAVAWVAVPRRNWNAALLLSAAAIAPDLDLLVGDHRGISHSVGAAAVAGAVAWAVFARTARRDAARWGVAVALAWASHVALDWLSNDTRPPIGVMALWPAARDYFKASIEIFPPVARQCCGARFWLYNTRAVLVECVILMPVMWLAVRVSKRR